MKEKFFFTNNLKNIYSKREIEYYYKCILRDVFKRELTQLALDPHSYFQTAEIVFLEKVILKLQKQMPLQYILGKGYFHGLTLKVNEKVLIPRPETEELVNWILEDNNLLEKPKKIVLDIGTGSGCIAIALAKNYPQFSIYALDLNNEILEVARENAELCNVQINFFKQDITNMKPLGFNLDIIVSNPPYVMQKEKKYIGINVMKYEPQHAIFVPKNDPLLFYRCILEFATSNLIPKGFIYLEVNPLNLEKLKNLINDDLYSVLERIDIFGKVRMLRLQKK